MPGQRSSGREAPGLHSIKGETELKRRKEMVLTTNHKIIALGLAAALLGGTVGAVVEHSAISNEATAATATKAAPVDQNSQLQPGQDNAALDNQSGQNVQTMSANAPVQTVATTRTQPVRTRVVTRTVYAQPAPRKQSGWEKHRDILTVAMGAGGGALLGGLIGGRKGTAIGAAAGAGGGALYTYKLRKKNRN